MANKSLGFIRRNIRCCKPNSKDESYKTIIRPWPSSEYEFNSVGPIHQTTHKLIGSMEMHGCREWQLDSYSTPGTITTIL